MTVLLQISDPHFGTEVAPVAEALRRFVARLRPDVTIWSGDITQRARAAQFQTARRFADGLGVPQRLAIPGNHDIPLLNLAARIGWPYRGYEQHFGGTLSPELQLPGLLAIGVKTTRRWRHKHGEISPAQVAQVAQRLRQAAPGQLRLVVLHQPLFVPQTHDRVNRVRGAGWAAEQWAAAGADVVMGGHIHLPYHACLQLQGRPLWVVQAGTALSSRVRDGEPNSVNVLRHDGHTPRRCQLERWDFLATEGEFRQVQAVEMGLGALPVAASGPAAQDPAAAFASSRST